MKIRVRNQESRFVQHLTHLKGKPVLDYNTAWLTEKAATLDVNTAKKLNQLNHDFIFDYMVFPHHIMTHLSQWAIEQRKMHIGDTIVQQVFIPPLRRTSIKVVVGVRINEIIHESNRVGFSYETLEGHVERGVSTFTIEQRADRIVVRIQTYSKPGNMLARLAGPFLSVPYQTYCNSIALQNMKRQLEEQ